MYAGIILTASLLYFLTQKFGKKFIYAIVSKEKINKIENSKFWRDSKKLDIALFIAYFIPGTPKGLITYIGALLPMSLPKFLIILSIARFPELISSTITGSNIIKGNWITILLAYVTTFLISSLIFFIYNKFISNTELQEKQD